ncbi:MAG: immunoglobulin domain-containing protein [Phycisphaerae bacterium]
MTANNQLSSRIADVVREREVAAAVAAQRNHIADLRAVEGRGGRCRPAPFLMAMLAMLGLCAFAPTPARAQPVEWNQLALTGPAPRYAPAMAYDAAHGVTVLFGGFTNDEGSLFSSETWEWNGTAWTQRVVSGPSGRAFHAMAYDAARGVTVLFGGYNSLGDTWEWNGTLWTQRAVSGPNARYGHAMVYDAGRGVTVLFGGSVSGIFQYGDTWEWNGNAWTQRVVSGPSPREQHSMAYDAARGVTVLFGGVSGPAGFKSDTWEWTGNAWSQRSASGPAPRDGHTIVYDAARGVTVLFGGSHDSGYSGDTWEWNGSAWTQRVVSGPSARYQPAMAYDAARGVTVLFGGYTVLGVSGETWEFGVPCAELPSVTAQPANQTLFPESLASFTVGASGTGPLSYQWRRAGANLTDNGHIAGATTATLTITNVQPADAGAYDVVITDVCGSIASTPASLTVNPDCSRPPFTSFYTFDSTSDPTYDGLRTFDADPSYSASTFIGFFLRNGNPQSLDCDLAPDGRFFVAPYGDTIYEVNPLSGAILGAVTVDCPIEGLAAVSGGLIYVSHECSGGVIWTVNFDTGQSSQLVGGYGEIDDIDFDADGNLIGNDINQSGRIYRIPLDGSQPVLIDTVPVTSIGGMSFSARDSAFWFVSDEGRPGGKDLWRLNWSNGQPAGELQYVKEIGAGGYIGIAVRPPPLDCNANGIRDECEPDCDGDGIPDDCDPGSCCPNFPDCNGNGLPDECECTGAPIIDEQPVTQSICLPHDPQCFPGNAVLCVEAQEPQKQCYRWQKQNPLNPATFDDLPANDAHYDGVASACLTIVGVTLADEGAYRAVVSNGCGTTPSESATLTLFQSVCIFNQPDDIVSACAGSYNHVLEVDTIGGGGSVTYQWFKRSTGQADELIGGQSGQTLALSPIHSSDAGEYYVVATSATCNVASRAATVSVYLLCGDLNEDGACNLTDLAKLLSNFGESTGMTRPDGDLVCDGDVDLSDLSRLLAHFGQSCPGPGCGCP